MKFNKKNPIHYFIYFYGFALFNVIYFFVTTISNKKENDIILYGHNLFGNLKSLYFELEKNQFSFFYLTLDKHKYNKLKSDNINVLYGLKIKDLITVVKARVMVADHGLHYFSRMINDNDKLFFDVNHGVPFQKWNKKIMKQWYKFTEVWLLSEFHKNIYVNQFGYEKNNLFITGYGRLDFIENYKKSSNKLETLMTIKKKYNIPIDKKIVLYAPTWIHNNKLIKDEFMLPTNFEFLTLLNEICEELKLFLIFRPHMNTQLSEKYIKKLQTLSNIKFLPFKKFDNPEDFLIISDILLTDYSSISFDYLLLDRPVLFLNVNDSFNNGLYMSETLRFGILTNLKDLKYNISKYLDSNECYFNDTDHLKFKNKIFDIKLYPASENYVDRIKKYIN